MKRFVKVFCMILVMLSVSVCLSSCALYSYYKAFREDSRLWDELEASIDNEVASKDTSSYHGARYQVQTRVIMSDIERQSSDYITAMFSDKVISDIGEEELRASIEEMERLFQGELLSYETQPSGGSGHRGGNGETTETYKVIIYTDMDIYEMYLYYVTVDTSSDDFAVNPANEGVHRIVVFPVSVSYGGNGLEDTPYPDYLDKEGVFCVAGEEAARNVKYDNKSYTGYSIAYLQVSHYESAVKESCENLMEILSTVGFAGDITDITYISEEDFAKAYEAGYNRMITDTSENRFFVQTPQYENDNLVQSLRIADADMQMLYEGE